MHQYAHGIPSSNLEKLESKLFLLRPTVQIANVSPFCWKIVETKFFTLPSPSKLICHSSYISSPLPKIFSYALQIFPCPLAFIFPFFFSFLNFLPHLLTNQFKIQKKNTYFRFNCFPTY